MEAKLAGLELLILQPQPPEDEGLEACTTPLPLAYVLNKCGEAGRLQTAPGCEQEMLPGQPASRQSNLGLSPPRVGGSQSLPFPSLERSDFPCSQEDSGGPRPCWSVGNSGAGG